MTTTEAGPPERSGGTACGQAAASRQIKIRGTLVEVVRKDIKHLHVGVYPPHGRVRVATPLRLDDEAVRLAVVSRLGWIRRKRAEFEKQDRESQREYVTGESHYFEGRRYRLDVTKRDGRPKVWLAGNARIGMRVRPGADCDAREALLYRWYRRQLRARLPALVAKWEPKVGVRIAEVRIKKMKTLWGACTPEARRLWVNLELVKKPPSCLEYILVHEMVHLIERTHNARFRELMDRAMPLWHSRRDELNRSPLAHEDWSY